MCHNMEGGYKCSCAEGYVVGLNNKTECVAASGMREKERGREEKIMGKGGRERRGEGER